MTTCGFSSCGGDDDDDLIGGNGGNGGTTTESPEPNPSQVFPAGIPQEANGYSIKTDDAGRVSEISDEYGLVKFAYGKFSRAIAATTEFNAKMEIYDTSYNGNSELEYIIYLQLNKDGFITYALEEYADDEDNEIDEWRFGYNSDGQINYMFRTEGDNEENFLTYADGNVIKNELKENGKVERTTNVLYTNKTITTPIVNKGGIMEFDDAFELDMDEMVFAYYAGMLGKPTKNLPVGNVDISYDDNYPTYTGYYGLRWEMNDNGLPTAMYYYEMDADGNITWENSYPEATYKW